MFLEVELGLGLAVCLDSLEDLQYSEREQMSTSNPHPRDTDCVPFDVACRSSLTLIALIRGPKD